MSMSQAELVASLKSSLQDAAAFFTAASDADYKRHLDQAAQDFGRVQPRVLRAVVTLAAGQAVYTSADGAPQDMVRLNATTWGVDARRARQPWDDNWPGPLPRARVVRNGAAIELHLAPAPSAAQITALGSDYPLYYSAAHAVGADAASTTIHAQHRARLLLRAQAEAMKELAMRGVAKPVQLRDGLSGAPRNAHPAALHEQLMAAFERGA